MKKIFLLFFIFLCFTVSVFGQYTVGIFTVPDASTSFGKVKANKTMVFQKDVGHLYYLTANATAIDTLTTASKSDITSGVPIGDLSIVNGDLLFEATGTLAINDYRFHPNGVYFDIERWNGASWDTQSRIGGSFFVNNYIEIIKEATNGAVYLRDSTGLRNLVASTNFTRGTLVGDIDGETYVSGENNVFKSTVKTPFAWVDVQTDESLQFAGTSFYVNYTTADADGFKTTKIDVSPVSIPINNIVQIQVFLQSDLVNPLWQNVTYEELQDGIGDTIDQTTGEVTLNIPFTGIPDAPVRVVVNSVDSITLKGSTNDGTDLYFRSYDAELWADDIVAFQTWKTGTDYSVNDKIWQDKDIYICNIGGVQTTSFASNSTKWDLFSLSSDLAKRVQTTGLLEGGVISIGSPTTTVSWTSGEGQITDYSDPTNPKPHKVEWNAVTNLTVTNVGTNGTTLFGYDSTGSVVQRLSTAVSIEDSHDIIFFGSATHLGGAVVAVITAPGNIAFNGIGSFSDFVNLVIGPANVDGNVYDANGANMNIDVIGGNAFMIGSNFRTDPSLSDIITLANDTTVSFQKMYRSAGAGLSMIYDGAATTTIDPSKYDDGTGSLVTTTAGYWTIQRIYRGRTGGTFVAYGQEEFTTKSAALAALGSESFTEKSPLPFTLYRCSLLVVQGATDLSDTSEAEFHTQSSFRVSGAQSSSVSIPGVTSPGGSDKSVQYNNGGVFGGDTNFQYDTATKELTLTKNNTDTAIPQLLIKQDGTGDAVQQYEADSQTWSEGLDNSNLNKFKVSSSNDLGTDSKLELDVDGNAAFGVITGGRTGYMAANKIVELDNSRNLILSKENNGRYVGFGETSGATEWGMYSQGEPQSEGRFKMYTWDTWTGGGRVNGDKSRWYSKGEIGMGLHDRRLMVGDLASNQFAASTLHVYEDNAAVNAGAGFTIEQEGTGDAMQHFVLSGASTWSMGVDNSDSDAFKISATDELADVTLMTIETNGNITMPGNLQINGELTTLGDTLVSSASGDVILDVKVEGGNGIAKLNLHGRKSGTSNTELNFYNYNSIDGTKYALSAWLRAESVLEATGTDLYFATTDSASDASAKLVIRGDGDVEIMHGDLDVDGSVTTPEVITPLVTHATDIRLRSTAGDVAAQVDASTKQFEILGLTHNDDDAIINIATTDGDASIYVGTDTPVGSVSATGGSFYLRDDELDSSFYIKKSAGAASTSGWEEIGHGDVAGPGSSATNSIAIFDSTTGKSLSDFDHAKLTDAGQTTNLELTAPTILPGAVNISFHNGGGGAEGSIGWSDISTDEFLINSTNAPMNFTSTDGIFSFTGGNTTATELKIIAPDTTSNSTLTFTDSSKVDQFSILYNETADKNIIETNGTLYFESSNAALNLLRVDSPSVTGTAGFVLSDFSDSSKLSFLYSESASISQIQNDAVNGLDVLTTNRIKFKSVASHTIPLLLLEATGSGGADIAVHVGDENPEGTITTTPGGLYARASGVDSNVFIHKAASSGNTGWERLVSENISKGIFLTVDNSSVADLAECGITMQNTDTTDDTFTSINHMGQSAVAASIKFNNEDYSNNYGRIKIGIRDAIGFNEDVVRIDANGVKIEGDHGDAEPPLVLQTTAGLNNGTTSFYVSDQDPYGEIDANSGSLAFREYNKQSNMWFQAGQSSGEDDWHTIVFPRVKTITSTLSIGRDEDYLRVDATAAIRVLTLPDATLVPLGKDYKFKLVAKGAGYYGEITPYAGDSIDGSTSTRRLATVGDVFTLRKVSDTGWDIVQSARDAHAEMYMTGGEITSQTGITTTAEAVEAWTDNGDDCQGIITSDQANNKFVINHVEDTVNGDHYKITANLTYEFDSSQLLELSVYVDGSPTTLRTITKGLGFSSDQLNTTLTGDFTTTSTGDVEVMIKSVSGTNDVSWWTGHVDLVRH